MLVSYWHKNAAQPATPQTQGLKAIIIYSRKFVGSLIYGLS